MKKLSLSFILLILATIGISLLLPKLPASDKITLSYEVNQKSLFNPIPMTHFLLVTPLPVKSKFTLRLGLYSELNFAVEAANYLKVSEQVFIVKTIDKTREWYLILLGEYETIAQAEIQKQQLQKNQQSATLMLLPKGLVL